MPIGSSLMEELHDSERMDLESWVASQSPAPVNSLGWPGWGNVLRRRHLRVGR
jgi:hypothetical protein